jgi:hypothetical protein
MTYPTFPPFVVDVLDELKSEPETQSIWFIGSRANNRERSDSDWDFIAFVKDNVREISVRHQNVDIIRVDLEGNYLLEGQRISMRSSFENWRWVEAESGIASYTVRETPYVREGESFSADDVKYTKLRGINIWQRNA